MQLITIFLDFRKFLDELLGLKDKLEIKIQDSESFKNKEIVTFTYFK